MATIRPTRTRPTTRYQDENVIQTGPKSTSIAGKPQQQQPVKSVLGVNNNHNIQVDEKKATAVGVKRPALASKDQQPPRKVSKHSRSSSVTSKVDYRSTTTTGVSSRPFTNTAPSSLNIIASTSAPSIAAKQERTSRQPSLDPSVIEFSDAPTIDDNEENQPRPSHSQGSGLTPSLTEMGVEAHPSSSRYMDAGEVQGEEFADAILTDSNHMQQQAASIPEETEEDLNQDGAELNEIPEQGLGPIFVEEHEDWLSLTEGQAQWVEEEMVRVKERFVDEVDELDCTMVAEYADEIFELMGELEEQTLPIWNYMDSQTEMDWSMRTTLIDWLVQVHLRYHMLPETLWIAVNIVDRFLSERTVSLIKLQLVGVTAMFIAAKYEEILAPSVDEFVYMTEGGYSKDEILKGERIILQTLDFDISSYCSPYSWVRKISKADDYDVQTRTLSKYLMEVTLLDHRFLRAKPSMIAAIGMYLSRRMLDRDWSEGFTFYSGFTEIQLCRGARLLTETLADPEFKHQYVFKKYATKKFLNAAKFAQEWAMSNVEDLADASTF